MSAPGGDILAWLDDAITRRVNLAQQTAAAYGASWSTDDSMESVRSDTGADVLDEPGAPREYIAANDPASVLRRCAADRKLLELHSPVEMPDEMADACKTCEVTGDYPYFPCVTLLVLAEGYGWTGGER